MFEIPIPVYYFLGFLIFILLFKKPIGKLIEGIKTLSVKKGDLDAKIECEMEKVADPSQEKPASDKELLREEKKEEKVKDAEAEETPKTSKEARTALYYAIFLGDTPNEKKMLVAYLKWQELEKDPTEKLRIEAVYYSMRYTYLNDHAAFDQLKKLLDHKEIESVVHGHIGNSLEKANLPEKALFEYESALSSAKAEPDKVSALKDLAKCLYKLDKKPEAFARLGEGLNSISMAECKADLYEGIADLYEKEGNHEMRGLALLRELEYRPNNEDILFRLGYSFSESGFDEISLLYYNNAERINPNRGGLINNIGVGYERLNMPIRSTNAYKKAVEVKESLAAANLAYRYMNAGFDKEATDILDLAKMEKDLHPNVGSAIADLSKKREEEDKRNKEIGNIAVREQQFLNTFADYYFKTKMDLPDIAGQWRGGDFSVKSEMVGKKVIMEIVKNDKRMKVVGEMVNRASKIELYNEERYLRYLTVERTGPVEYADFSDKKGYLYFDDAKKEINIMLLGKANGSPEFIKLQKI